MLVACSSGSGSVGGLGTSSIVGRWANSDDAGIQSITLWFNQDSSWGSLLSNGGATLCLTGTWQTQGSTLTITYKDGQVRSGPFSFVGAGLSFDNLVYQRLDANTNHTCP
jgi:hypothetical protein